MPSDSFLAFPSPLSFFSLSSRGWNQSVSGRLPNGVYILSSLRTVPAESVSQSVSPEDVGWEEEKRRYEKEETADVTCKGDRGSNEQRVPNSRLCGGKGGGRKKKRENDMNKKVATTSHSSDVVVADSSILVGLHIRRIRRHPAAAAAAVP